MKIPIHLHLGPMCPNCGDILVYPRGGSPVPTTFTSYLTCQRCERDYTIPAQFIETKEL